MAGFGSGGNGERNKGVRLVRSGIKLGLSPINVTIVAGIFAADLLEMQQVVIIRSMKGCVSIGCLVDLYQCDPAPGEVKALRK